MNLHNQLPSNIYLVSTTTTDVSAAPKNGKFFSITCTAAGTVKVRGGAIREYVDIDNASSSDVVKYIDPNTGAAYVNQAAATGDPVGFYQRVATEESHFPMIAGQTIYGKFDSVKSDGAFTGFAYAG